MKTDEAALVLILPVIGTALRYTSTFIVYILKLEYAFICLM